MGKGVKYRVHLNPCKVNLGIYLPPPTADGPRDDPEGEKRPDGEAELADGLEVQGIPHGAALGVGAAGPDAALLEEPVVVALEQEGLDLAHGVQDDAHRDQ